MIEFSPEYNDINIKFRDDENCSNSSIAGFHRYIINGSKSDIIDFNVTNENKRRANYMIRYYIIKDNDEDNNNNETISNIDTKYEPIFHNSFDNKNISISFKFNSIKVNKNITEKENIDFYITGVLFKMNQIIKELINTTSFLYERKRIYVNKTFTSYNSTNN